MYLLLEAGGVDPLLLIVLADQVVLAEVEVAEAVVLLHLHVVYLPEAAHVARAQLLVGHFVLNEAHCFQNAKFVVEVSLLVLSYNANRFFTLCVHPFKHQITTNLKNLLRI